MPVWNAGVYEDPEPSVLPPIMCQVKTQGKTKTTNLIHSHSLILCSLLKARGQDNPPRLASWRLLIPSPEEISSCFLLRIPRGPSPEDTDNMLQKEKKKFKKKVIMEKVQRKTCFCSAAEAKQELSIQQELLAPHSWSSEDRTGEAELGRGMGSSRDWAPKA